MAWCCAAMCLVSAGIVRGGGDNTSQPAVAAVPATRPASPGVILATRPAIATTQAIRARLGPEPPQVEAVDRVDLAKLARRAMLREAQHEQAETPSYTPSSLEGLKCRASVTLRLRGRMLGTADSARLPVMEAVAQAGVAALKAASINIINAAVDLDELGLEIELTGGAEQVGHGGEAAARLADHFEAGIHGVGVRFDDKEVLVRPSQLISMETFCERDDELDHHCDRYEIAIKNLQEKLGLTAATPSHPPESVSVWRFRTTHWYQPAAGAEPVLLTAGMRLVRPEEVTLDAIRAASEDLAGYLRRRQAADGLFSYEFMPGRDVYWPMEQNWVRQAGVTWALARYARLRGDAETAASAERAIAGLQAMVRPVPGNPHGSYLFTPDSLHPLGATALYALALMDSPSAEKHVDLLASLMVGIEGLQRENGQIRGHFPPCQREASEDYYPGEALLAIARYHSLHPSSERRTICDRALPFYTRYFRETHSVPFIPWQVQAWGELARTTRLRKYADFVFEMTDYLVARQLAEPQLPLAIYDGGIDMAGNGRSGMNTGVYLEGIVDAILTADAFGETERASRYRVVAWRAARFVIQMRFREEECYYVQSPREVVGGVRNMPDDPTLRIDSTQHALAGLMGLADVMAK